MDCRLKVFCSGLWEFAILYSKAITLETKNIFTVFLSHLWNLYQILNFFKIQKMVIGNVFPKLQTVKELVRPLTKKHRFRTSFESQHVKGSQTIVKSSSEHFYHIFLWLRGQMICETFPLLMFEIIGVFANTWTADYIYPLRDCENFPFAIQMKLS